MKKKTKIISIFICVIMICMALSPVTSAAAKSINPREGYIDIEIPFDASIGSGRQEFALTRSSGTLVGNGAMFNAFLAPGQTTAYTNMAIWDFRDNSIPQNARITNVTVTSTRTNVPGMTYYVCVGRSTPWGDDWAPNMLWNSTVSTSWFNGEDPWGYWALDFYVTRVITPPDFGAGATVSSATLRIFYSY